MQVTVITTTAKMDMKNRRTFPEKRSGNGLRKVPKKVAPDIDTDDRPVRENMLRNAKNGAGNVLENENALRIEESVPETMKNDLENKNGTENAENIPTNGKNVLHITMTRHPNMQGALGAVAATANKTLNLLMKDDRVRSTAIHPKKKGGRTNRKLVMRGRTMKNTSMSRTCLYHRIPMKTILEPRYKRI